MTTLKYTKQEKISLKEHPEFKERWVQERIAEDPSLLGLGDLILKDKERIQPHAGRLDLLFQDADTSHRYEVELQLGRTDEAHIIRTIEYWDVEQAVSSIRPYSGHHSRGHHEPIPERNRLVQWIHLFGGDPDAGAQARR